MKAGRLYKQQSHGGRTEVFPGCGVKVLGGGARMHQPARRYFVDRGEPERGLETFFREVVKFSWKNVVDMWNSDPSAQR